MTSSPDPTPTQAHGRSPRPLGPLLVVLALLGVLALVAGCSSSGSSSSGSSGSSAASASSGASASGAGLRKVRVVLDWTPNTNHSGVYIAKQLGWYRAAGLDVQIIEPGDSTSSTQLLAAGKADIAFAAGEDVVAGRSQGLPVVSIAAVIQHNTSSLVALPSSGITKDPRSLTGKTYGGFGGPLEESLVKKLTACSGGDPATIKFVNVGNSDYRVGMERGDYQFVWIFDGWDGVRYQLDHLTLVRIPFIDHTSCIPDEYTPVLETREGTIAKDPAMLKAFMAATTRGYQKAIADPQAATSALMAGAPELDRKLVSASATYLASRYADDPARWGQQDPAVWKAFSAFVVASKMAASPVDSSTLFTNAFLPNG